MSVAPWIFQEERLEAGARSYCIMGVASGRRDLESECLRHRAAERRWQDNVRERIFAGVRGLQELHQRRFDRTRSVTIQARSRRLPRRALMLEEIKLAVKHRESFGFETTLAGRSYLSVIRRLKKLGYEVHFFFLWVPTVELALTRVKARVVGGGHDVPETVVRRRFDRSIRNFLVLYRSLSDSWTLLNNSGITRDVIAFEKSASLRIMNQEIYEALIASYGKP